MFAVLCTVLAVLAVACLWVILYDTHHFVTVKYSLSLPFVKKDTRIVMISDLHNYCYGKENGRLTEAIDALKPDMIVLAGDMITSDAREKFDGTMKLLKRLNERYPVYYAYGNHEQKIQLYKKYENMGKKFEKALEETGIRPLRNTHVELAERGITIYGLEIDHSLYKRLSRDPLPEGCMKQLLGAPRQGTCRILIAHDPEYFPDYAGWGADLVLAGHIHGGIVRVPFLGGVISPSLWLFPKYDGGLFREGTSTMVLGRGLGTHSPRVRLFNPAELVVVDIGTQKGEQN